ncbi:MAG: hypothetical protein EBT76_03765, partial [Microbacteriaceae bacterium]|nr:hypothetical protein [Microbacteriaceae bacterium]
MSVGKNAIFQDLSLNDINPVISKLTITGNVSVNGELYADNAQLNGDVSMNGNLYIGQNANMKSNVNIQGNLVVNKRVLQTLNNDPSYNNVNGYYALADSVQPIVSKQTAYDIGQNWQNATSGVLNNSWNSVCWSSELGLFCAVSSTGTSNERVMLSSNGITWENANSAPLGNWYSVCWSRELNLFLAVGQDNGNSAIVMTSNNGYNWNGSTLSIGGLRSVCWSPELSLFCAVGNSIAVSKDGINFTI